LSSTAPRNSSKKANAISARGYIDGYPDRIIGIYYPTLDSAQSNFAPKYQKYIETAPRFHAELRPTHGGKLG